MIERTTDFSKTSTLIIEILDNQQGVFIGVPHIDNNFHSYMAKTLLKNLQGKIKNFFVECSNGYLQQQIETIEKTILLGENNYKVKFNDEQKIQLLDMSIKNPMMLPILYAKIVYGIQVIGVDVAHEELQKVEAIFYNPCEEHEIIEAQNKRLEHNQKMIENIKNLSGTDKYVMFGGPQHGDISEQLGIKNINVCESQLHTSIVKLISENKNYKSLVKPDYLFLYTANTPKLSLLFNNQGFFSPSKHANKNNPYGPYSDQYCFEDDPLVRKGIELSR